MIMGLYMHKIIIVAQAGLRYVDGAVSIPFSVIAPGGVYFLDEPLLFLFRRLLGECKEWKD
jgi:hypothetical protein